MEEKQLHSTIQSKEEDLRLKSLVLDQIKDHVTITDLNGVITYVNDAEVKTLQLSRDEIMGKKTNIYGEDTEKGASQEEILERTIKDGAWRGEVVNYAADGTELIMDCRTQLIYDENGNPVALCGISTNITERKHIEKALLESELSYKSIFDYASDAIFIQDQKGLFLEVNQAAIKMYGYSRGEMVGFTPEKLAAPGRNKMKEINVSIKEAFEGFTRKFEWWGKRKNGEIFPGEVVLNKGKYFGREVVIAMARDITEIYTALNALRESEDKFRSLNRQLPLGIYRTATDGQLVYSNPALVKMLNYDSMEELLTLNVKELYVYPAEREKQLRASKKTSEVIQNEFQLRKKTGELIWVRDNSRLIFDNNGKPVYFDGVLEDITIQKIEQKELVEAKEKAEESDRLKTVFLANVSHEIRTPMNAILGFLELLKNPCLRKENIDEYIDIIDQSGQRLLSTINDIIEISKIESGQSEVIYSEESIPEILQYHYSFFRQQCHENGITLTISSQSAGNELYVKTDKHKLESILTNLINNAVKFTSCGSIEFGCNLKENYLEFFVKDTGVGIPEDRLEAIFKRFVQADISNIRPHEGSGLGLSIAKAYVEMLNGEIWVESESGRGSTFFFRIPYIPAEKIKSESDVHPDRSSRIPEGYTILIAEDDEFSCKYLEIILSRECISLIFTTNGRDTVTALMENPQISLILMDIKMPDMDGLEATEQIREFNKSIPIIIQSAYAQESDKQNAFQAGCNDYITKPVMKEELIGLIYKYLGLKDDFC